jgi:hypothetical protein
MFGIETIIVLDKFVFFFFFFLTKRIAQHWLIPTHTFSLRQNTLQKLNIQG